MATGILKWVLAVMLVVVSTCVDRSHEVHAQEATANLIYLPLIQKNRARCAELRQPTHFGVQIYGASDKNSPYFKDLVESGASWVRVEMGWAGVEPVNTTPDNYNWAAADAVVAAAADGCMNVDNDPRKRPQLGCQIPVRTDRQGPAV